MQRRGGILLINSAAIIPTGDEILDGIVVDTDSPAVIQEIIKSFPKCRVTRLAPVRDAEEDIINKVDECVNEKYDLIVLIGGSGGGHRYYESASKDYTHSALERYLDTIESNDIYGKNGHMWCKLIAGTIGQSLVMNVPGPYVEATAAAGAFMEVLSSSRDLRMLVDAAANAVLKTYKSGGDIR